mgnify:CR=1 FL=1
MLCLCNQKDILKEEKKGEKIMKVIGITGSDGKTTTTTLIYEFLSKNNSIM